MSTPIRVVIVEDSPLASEVLTSILESDSDIRVVGVARNGVEALEQVPQLKPDLVTMDVWMPRMDGFATVEQLMAYHPTPILVITASLARSDVDISLTMLAAGALDVIEKPSRIDEATWERSCRALVQRVKTLARVRVVTHLKGRRLGGGHLQPSAPLPAPPAPPAAAPGTGPVPPPTALPDGVGNHRPTMPFKPLSVPSTQATPPARTPSAPSYPPPPPPRPTATAPPLPPRPVAPIAPPSTDAHTRMAGRRKGNTAPLPPLPPHPTGPNHHYDLVAIASSTGGPQALLKILRGLPPQFSTPILIVQHIAQGFTQGLADWLAREAGRPVRLAAEGERPQAGTALLAPDGYHMVLGPEGKITLDDGPPREIRPSADMTMRSVAGVMGNRAVGVILTGMGRDGAEGMRAMRMEGAYTIAQDEASCIIFGMPRAAISLGVIDEVLPLEAIAGRLIAVVGSRVHE